MEREKGSEREMNERERERTNEKMGRTLYHMYMCSKIIETPWTINVHCLYTCMLGAERVYLTCTVTCTIGCLCMCARIYMYVCVCVCVCERERERVCVREGG